MSSSMILLAMELRQRRERREDKAAQKKAADLYTKQVKQDLRKAKYADTKAVRVEKYAQARTARISENDN